MRARNWRAITSNPSDAGQSAIDLAAIIGSSEGHRWDEGHRWLDAYRDADDVLYADNPRTLGLHWERGNIAPSHFIGAVNLPHEGEDYPLVVRPREQIANVDFQNVDYGAMFAAVLAAPVDVTGMELHRLFGCDPDQVPIVANRLPQLTLLEVTAFLAMTARFIQRHLRQGFIRVRENLVGRVRGRILIANQIRENLVRARSDKMVCEFQRFNLDTLENRLLKAALEVSARYVSGTPGVVPELQRWVHVIRSALATVPDYQPYPRDWSRIRNKGLMAAYATPLALARLVLTRLHLRPTDNAVETGRTLPFFLDANRLFEGWVGVCLNQPDVCVSVQGQSQNRKFQLEGNSYYFRPDFVVKVKEAKQPQRKLVVDAKYKLEKLESSDLYQVIGYTRLLAQPAAQGGDCKTGECVLTEACLAIPENQNQNQHGVDASFAQFVKNWQSREMHGRCWGDGFRLTVVRVPLPIVVGHLDQAPL
jgi:5-methylcytosine-specific restriction endonuclease McrBC regulatory subunit McrC